MALDPERGIVYVPTGSAAADFYGANRAGDDLFANCLIALDAATGKRLWHFQAVRHDLWDRDFPSPPVLVTVNHEGKQIDAVAQTSKQGFVFLFDRTNGKPLFPIEYRPYPASPVEGEAAAPTQPLPTLPAPYARQLFAEDMVTNRNRAVHEWALGQFRKMRSAGQFVPFAVGQDTVVFPGYDGGGEWGGPAVDPETRIIYVNSNDIVDTGALEVNSTRDTTGRHVYLNQCAVCHHDDLAGAPPDFPSLQGIGSRMTQRQIATIIQQGRGRMPSFSNLPPEYVTALVHFIVGIEDKKEMQSRRRRPSRKNTDSLVMGSSLIPMVIPPWCRRGER